MQLTNFVVAEGISIDQTTNNVSLFNMLEEIRVQVLPIIIPSLNVLSIWSREDADGENLDFQSLLRICRPGCPVEEFPTNFQMTGPRHRTIHRLQGIPIEQFGTLVFEVLLNGKSMQKYVVPVTQDDSIIVTPTSP